MELIDGKKISGEIKEEVKEQVAKLAAEGREVTLAVVLVGNDPASQVYVRNKRKACEYVGIHSLTFDLEEKTSQAELLALVQDLNQREDVDGILVQLPLPPQIQEDLVIRAISPEKDVDGFHPMNVGALAIGEKGFVSCTPAGIIQLLKRSGVQLDGAHCMVIGRSNIVGKPMALLLLRENATVTVAHSHTRNLKEAAREADVLIVAVGRPQMITHEYVKEGAVVVDVGIHRREDGTLCGDVDFADVAEHTSKITPVPGGVGPMTIAMLLSNCVESAERNRE